ncbi:MAG: hypothetical protein DDT30_01751 [Dehalococcoidia bacterium]|nr:hypothetical protein [Bacillota bacterium]MBT9143583.1 hypothetical protein [Bacillota bacterium]
MTTSYPDNYLSQEEKTLGILAHFLALFTSIFGPLIIWLIKKDQSVWLDKQAKESLNFQISIAIYQFVSGILMFILIGFIFSIALWIFNIVFVVIASLRARNGENYRYPLCIRLIK